MFPSSFSEIVTGCLSAAEYAVSFENEDSYGESAMSLQATTRSHLAHLYFAGRHKIAFLPSLEQPQSLFQPEPCILLNRHDGFGVAAGEGVHVGQDEGAGAVAAKGAFVLLADDGEGVQHVAGVLTGEAVEVVERVEEAAQVAARFSSYTSAVSE